MKEKTKELYSRLAELTGSKCGTCDNKDKYRCCDKKFCDLVDYMLERLDAGIQIDKPNVGGIPYMSESGCVVPPHLRPYCTGYACFAHFKSDPTFKEKYNYLINRINTDPTAPQLPVYDEEEMQESFEEIDRVFKGNRLA